ncbi:MAG: hypothetical protein AB7H71_04740, partial [Alphaproteobacteria bacterium]
PQDIVVFGEIALSGRVRPVAHADLRLKEAAKLGFSEAWAPSPLARSRKMTAGDGLETAAIGHLSDLIALLSPSSRRRTPSQGTDRQSGHRNAPLSGAPRILVTR